MVKKMLVALFALTVLAVAPAVAAGSRTAPFPVTIKAANGSVVIKARSDEDRVAVADGNGDALRRRRGPAGGGRRRTVQLSGRCAAYEALRLHAERGGDRRLRPRPGRCLQRRRPRRRTPEAGDHRAARACRREPPSGVRRDPPTRPGDRSRGESHGNRQVHAGADHEADPLRAQRLPAPEGVSRARTRSVLGNVVDLHRPDLQGLRLPEHRRPRGLVAHGLSAALGRVHRVVEPGHGRARGLEVLRPVGEDGCSSSRVGEHLGVQHRRVVNVDDDIASRWGPRVVDFVRAVANAAKRS